MVSTLRVAAPVWVAVRAPARARVAGAAALGYVIAAGVENMEALRVPALGASAADVRAAYADEALATVTALSGVLSLLLYAVFAWALAPRLRRPGMALAAGLAGPALAFAGLAATLPLVTGGGLGMADGDVRAAADLQQVLRLLAGPCMATVLVCAGTSGILPRTLGRAACALAVPLALTPLALAGGDDVRVVAAVVFGLHLLCLWLASLWLVLGGVAPAVLMRRAAFLMLVVAAGLVGIALLIAPRATGAFFAWELAPASLAAFAGGVYVGSAALYAAGLRAPWREARALVAAAVVLSVSVLAISLTHLGPFDFGRLQAWAWMVLFAGFALATTALLATTARPVPAAGALLPAWARALLGGIAATLGALAVALWADPSPLPPLGGRFAGSWTMMLAVLAAWGAVAGRRDEARLPALALVALPAGALVAAVRLPEAELAYAGGLVLLIASGAAVLAACRA